MFRNLKNWSFITDKELECFTFNHKRVCNKNCTSFLNLIKGFLIYLIDQCFLIVEESEFLDRHRQAIMQESRSYVKDSGVFVKTMGQIGGIPKNSIFVNSDVVRLYYSIPHRTGLKKSKNVLERQSKNIFLLKVSQHRRNWFFLMAYFIFNFSCSKQFLQFKFWN